MKRALYFSAWGLMTLALAGCNRGWPNLFCCSSACQPEVYQESCDPCASGFAPSGTSGEWIMAPGTTTDSLPGPAVSRPSSG